MALEHLRSFATKAEFDAAKSGLPRPCVADYKHENDLFVFYRHADASVPDAIYTAGKSRFIIGYSPLGGEALLGAAKHATQTTVPSLL